MFRGWRLCRYPHPYPTLSIRARTSVEKLPQLLGKGYGEIAQYLDQLNEQPAGPSFAVYYNMDMQDLDVEFGFPVSKSFTGKGDIQARETPSGQAAFCVHVGPYSEVGLAHDALFQWIKDNGYQTTNVAYEIYMNDFDETPPEKLETQIYLLLKVDQ